MITYDDLTARTGRIESLLRDRLGLKHGSLGRRAARAGRRLPRAIRADLCRIGEAVQLSGHPRLRHAAEGGEITAACERVEQHLTGIDVRDRRIGAALGLAAVIGFNLLVVAVLFIAVLRWRGLA
ncbi:hypothetical protein [Roseivivax marinus]|uniref:hypothetical protein n=1 Tax=Roseivivax marinus TaxID=1379903 RepID=UPI00273DA078|nr:hypothetical protein [Roseivivax marinus]